MYAIHQFVLVHWYYITVHYTGCMMFPFLVFANICERTLHMFIQKCGAELC